MRKRIISKFMHLFRERPPARIAMTRRWNMYIGYGLNQIEMKVKQETRVRALERKSHRSVTDGRLSYLHGNLKKVTTQSL